MATNDFSTITKKEQKESIQLQEKYDSIFKSQELFQTYLHILNNVNSYKELKDKTFLAKRTITRHIKLLKDQRLIFVEKGKKGIPSKIFADKHSFFEMLIDFFGSPFTEGKKVGEGYTYATIKRLKPKKYLELTSFFKKQKIAIRSILYTSKTLEEAKQRIYSFYFESKNYKDLQLKENLDSPLTSYYKKLGY